jgi:hypothetical protein
VPSPRPNERHHASRQVEPASLEGDPHEGDDDSTLGTSIRTHPRSIGTVLAKKTPTPMSSSFALPDAATATRQPNRGAPMKNT